MSLMRPCATVSVRNSLLQGETTQNIVDVPTVQEQVIVQGIPEVQVVERIQEQIVESIPLERVQQRTVEQSVSLFERLDDKWQASGYESGAPARK